MNVCNYDTFLNGLRFLRQIDNGLMVGNSQVIFEKAESSSLTLVGTFPLSVHTGNPADSRTWILVKHQGHSVNFLKAEWT